MSTQNFKKCYFNFSYSFFNFGNEEDQFLNVYSALNFAFLYVENEINKRKIYVYRALFSKIISYYISIIFTKISRYNKYNNFYIRKFINKLIVEK